MVKTYVKICGITNLEDAQVAAEAGADFLGFIFYPKSSRYVTMEKVAQIVQAIREKSREKSSLSTPGFVGVFVNETAEGIRHILDEAGLDLAQLHGDETPEQLNAVGTQGYKALRPANAHEALEQAARYGTPISGDGPQLLVDTYDPQDPHAYGGTGVQSDWGVGAELASQYPRLILAGGLTPENVAQAVREVQPWCVDVASGVEASPGHKDHEKVRAFSDDHC